MGFVLKQISEILPDVDWPESTPSRLGCRGVIGGGFV